MNKSIYFSAIIYLAFVLCTSCGDGSEEENDIVDFDAYVAEQIEQQEIPALSVMIFEGEVIKYEKYFGQSDIENDLSLTQNDLFLMASVSKMVTGTALLQLYEEGEFDLDDKINDYLPFNITVPEQTTDITFRMLLTHTSAIDDGPNSEIFYSYGSDSPIGLKEYMEKYLLPNGEYYNATDNFHDFEPGTQHEYSNMASALIGVLVTEISGTDFQNYCRANIFQPLDMNDTYWSLDAALQSGKTLVNPYEYNNGGFEVIQHYTFPDYPNGALRSTARDMMKFLNAIAQNGTTNNHELLTANTVTEMLTPQIPNLDATMGLHIFLLDEDKNIWGHDGSEQGVSTEIGFNPTNKIGVIVLSNEQDVDVNTIFLKAYEYGLDI